MPRGGAASRNSTVPSTERAAKTQKSPVLKFCAPANRPKVTVTPFSRVMAVDETGVSPVVPDPSQRVSLVWRLGRVWLLESTGKLEETGGVTVMVLPTGSTTVTR